MKNLLKWQKNYGYTTGNLLEFLSHQNYYELIDIDFSGQTNTSILQKINFVGKLEEDNGTIMFFIADRQQKAIPTFFRFINCHRII